MYHLVILCVFDPFAKMNDREVQLDTEYEYSSQAELRALRWLEYRPNDIIMLEFIADAICKHCDLPIKEKAGWIIHQWIHVHTNTYLCWSNALTQAEPKEVA